MNNLTRLEQPKLPLCASQAYLPGSLMFQNHQSAARQISPPSEPHFAISPRTLKMRVKIKQTNQMILSEYRSGHDSED